MAGRWEVGMMTSHQNGLVGVITEINRSPFSVYILDVTVNGRRWTYTKKGRYYAGKRDPRDIRGVITTGSPSVILERAKRRQRRQAAAP